MDQNLPVQETYYDYLIIGSGLSGSLMAWQFCRDEAFRDKRILILEKEAHKGNDRTWCWWEKGSGAFDNVLDHHWDRALVKGAKDHMSFPLSPYRYKMMRSSSFYKAVNEAVAAHPGISCVRDEVHHLAPVASGVELKGGKQTYFSKIVLDSRPPIDLPIRTHAPFLYQHFIGWFVKTSEPVFDPSEVRFMDFSVPQKGNTRFMYLLPFSETEALVEYTLFSMPLLAEEEYETAIEKYLKNLGAESWEILEKEKGAIPMTTHDFLKSKIPGVIPIGTAGGWTKASTGYTFKRSVKFSKVLAERLKQERTDPVRAKQRFLWYDAILLEVLEKENESGAGIFVNLFKRNKPSHIFAFLDEESGGSQELRIILTSPTLRFIRAFGRGIRRWFSNL